MIFLPCEDREYVTPNKVDGKGSLKIVYNSKRCNCPTMHEYFGEEDITLIQKGLLYKCSMCGNVRRYGTVG
jgi:RNase P subunit RPR2